MQVIDLIIKLQQLPPNKKVMIDCSKEGGSIFRFASVEAIEEITTSENEEIVIVTPYSYLSEEDEDLN